MYIEGLDAVRNGKPIRSRIDDELCLRCQIGARVEETFFQFWHQAALCRPPCVCASITQKRRNVFAGMRGPSYRRGRPPVHRTVEAPDRQYVRPAFRLIVATSPWMLIQATRSVSPRVALTGDVHFSSLQFRTITPDLQRRIAAARIH